MAERCVLCLCPPPDGEQLVEHTLNESPHSGPVLLCTRCKPAPRELAPPPPPGVLVRTCRDWRVWRPNNIGGWVNGRWSKTWPELLATGDVELLVPVPYHPHRPAPTDQDVAEGLLAPVATLMQQLAAAAAAGLTAVVAAAYRRGATDAITAGADQVPAAGPRTVTLGAHLTATVAGFDFQVTDQLPAGIAAVVIAPPDPDDPAPLTARAAIIRDDRPDNPGPCRS